MIVRERTADRINEVLNHPDVRPWVADGDARIDLSAAVADERNVALMGNHGGCFFYHLQPGVYEVHTQVIPSGRGKWTAALTEACAHFMFTRTDAYEIVTRIPRVHKAARAAAQAQGMRHEFTRRDECLFLGQKGDVDIFSFRFQDWAASAIGAQERGSWLHERMEAEAGRLGIDVPTHDDDPNHNHYVGIAFECALGGQAAKGVAFYNRWVSLVRHSRDGVLQHISLVSTNPVIIRFDIGLMKIEGGDLEIIREC